MSKRILVLFLHSLWLGGQIAVGQPGEITVKPNVQVSKARGSLVHNEVLLSADPTNPNRLLGCTMAFSPAENKVVTIAYVSFDEGKSWEPAVTNERGIHSGDPACSYGVNGTAFFTAIERIDNADSLVLYRSMDGGKNWAPPVVLHGSMPLIDRPYVIVDNSGNRDHGRVYVYGQIAQRTVDGESLGYSIALWRSMDNGSTFEGPIVRSPNKQLAFHPANSVVLSDGTLVCLFSELDSQKRNDGYIGSQYRKADVQNGTLKVIVSNDGGESFVPAFKISDQYYDWRQEASSTPSLGVDRGSAQFKDRLYAVWADGRYGRTQILVSHSKDKGRTWSKPQLVSDDQPTLGNERNNFMPVVATNSDGVVGVMWYDRRDNPDNIGYYVRFAASLDGGETWLPSIRVSEAPKVFESQGNWPIRAFFLHGGDSLTLALRRYEWIAGGHTAGMAADTNGIFHPFWVDNRTGVSQIWTAAVAVKGAVNRNGSSELAHFDDVSKSISVELTNCAYESAPRIVSCNTRLKNTSKDALQGPLKLRVIALRSELGQPKVVNADNGASGAGAVWDFSVKLKGDSLGPGDTSESKQLQFQILNPRPFRQGDYFKFTFVELEAKVLGQLKRTLSDR